MNIALKYFKNESSIGQISVYAEARNWVNQLRKLSHLIQFSHIMQEVTFQENLKLHVQ